MRRCCAGWEGEGWGGRGGGRTVAVVGGDVTVV